MLSSTIQYKSVGTKCISIMTRMKQPVTVRSFVCCASHVVNKLLPVGRLRCNYFTKCKFMDMNCITQLSSLHLSCTYV
jgi:hypothetical protein